GAGGQRVGHRSGLLPAAAADGDLTRSGVAGRDHRCAAEPEDGYRHRDLRRSLRHFPAVPAAVCGRLAGLPVPCPAGAVAHAVDQLDRLDAARCGLGVPAELALDVGPVCVAGAVGVDGGVAARAALGQGGQDAR
ncbi:hypothetical protein CEJ63_21375, partial [Acinetobacter baumannii]